MAHWKCNTVGAEHTAPGFTGELPNILSETDQAKMIAKEFRKIDIGSWMLCIVFIDNNTALRGGIPHQFLLLKLGHDEAEYHTVYGLDEEHYGYTYVATLKKKEKIKLIFQVENQAYCPKKNTREEDYPCLFYTSRMLGMRPRFTQDFLVQKR